MTKLTPEGRVKAEIKRGLDDYGAYYFMPVQTGMGSRTLDFLVCYKGHFIAIEAKRADGKGVLTTIQRRIVEKISTAGGIAFAARNWDDVKYILELFDQALTMARH